MELGIDFRLEPLCNIDHVDITSSLSYLEIAPPCKTYYDFGDQLKSYVYKTFLSRLKAGAAEKVDIIEYGDVSRLEARKVQIKERMKKAIGGIPESAPSLNPQIIGILYADGYRIEKIILTSRHNVYVTGNLYVPDNLNGETGAVLFVCGHAKEAKAYPEYQYVCRLIAKAGLIVFVIDPVGQGERFSYINRETFNQDIEWGCPEHDHAGAQIMMAGDSSARYFVHDAMCAVDYLISRPEVDGEHIGITGNSGGGTQTALMMLLDSRIKAAAPGTFISAMEELLKAGVAQDAEQIWNGMMEHGFDHDDIILCMSPKPVMLLAVTYDFFPIEGTRKTFHNAKRYYEMYGLPKNIELHEDSSDHKYTKKLAYVVADFFSRHFLGHSFESKDIEERSFSFMECACTAKGQVRLEYCDARFMYDENIVRAKELIMKRRGLPEEELKEKAISWLSERVSFNRLPCSPNLRRFSHIRIDELIAETLIFWSNEGVFTNALYFLSGALNKHTPVHVNLALWDGGTASLKSHIGFIRKKCGEGEAVMVMDLSGSGAQSPNRVNTMPMHSFEGTMCAFSHDLIWQNDSLTALRAFEILAAINMLECEMNLGHKNISIYARGFASVPAAIAYLLCHGKLASAQIDVFPEDRESLVSQRIYDSFDVMNQMMPGSLEFFDFSDLKRWVEDKNKLQ